MIADMSGLRSPGHEPLRSLVCRYWFWSWLFTDVNSRDPFIRRQRWRQNVAARGFLVVYVRRWLFGSAAMALVGALLESSGAAILVAAAFYSAAILAVIVASVATTAWVMLPRAASS